ncbi:MAG: phosphoglycolate phosphatase [Pseudomonadales bacterium]|nr:phosphoglycolate phosphatase [Pseudomonadales bacterium]
MTQVEQNTGTHNSTIELQSYDLIMFDLDGTLVDSVPDLSNAMDATLNQHGLPSAGVERVRDWVGNGAAKLVSRGLAWAKQCTEDELARALFDEVYLSFLEHYGRTNGQYARLYEGVLPLLTQLKGNIPLAVVTNKPMAFTTPLLNALGIDHYFAHVAGGDSFPEKKPHPQPLQEIINAANAQNPVMIGDSISDVKAARAANIPVVCVSYGYNHGQDIRLSNPDLVIDSLASLL